MAFCLSVGAGSMGFVAILLYAGEKRCFAVSAAVATAKNPTWAARSIVFETRVYISYNLSLSTNVGDS